jgi:hypothetical protein
MFLFSVSAVMHLRTVLIIELTKIKAQINGLSNIIDTGHAGTYCSPCYFGGRHKRTASSRPAQEVRP